MFWYGIVCFFNIVYCNSGFFSQLTNRLVLYIKKPNELMNSKLISYKRNPIFNLEYFLKPGVHMTLLLLHLLKVLKHSFFCLVPLSVLFPFLLQVPKIQQLTFKIIHMLLATCSVLPVQKNAIILQNVNFSISQGKRILHWVHSFLK